MGMYKDENEGEDDFNNSLLNKSGFPHRPQDRDVCSHFQIFIYSDCFTFDIYL